MDIRNYFGSKKVKKVKDDEDSDVIPDSPNVQIKEKKKQSRKRRQIADDSDEEIFSKNKTTKSCATNSKTKDVKVTTKSTLKEVKACDIFSTSIKRSEPLVKKTPKKTEIGLHSDDEFEKSLLEIDEIEIIEKTKSCNTDNISKDKKSPVKYKNTIKEEEKQIKHEPADKIDDHIQEIDKKARKRKADQVTNGEVNGEKFIEKKEQKKPDLFIEKKEQKKPDSFIEKKEQKKSDSFIEKKEQKKTDFREFLENDDSLVACDDDNSAQPMRKKQKVDKSLNESVLSDEERHERKRYSAALYQKYLNRTGPKNLGAKEIPKGAPNCLRNCAFLLTGVLESFERDEIVAAITEYGGVVKTGISKKVTHVLAGDDAGPAKLAKAQDLGITVLNEDEFLQMIANSLNKNSKDNKSNRDKKEKNSPKNKNHETKSTEKNKNEPKTSEKSKKEPRSTEKNKKHESRSTEKDKKHNGESSNKKSNVESGSNGILKTENDLNGITKSDTKIKVKEERKSVSPKKHHNEMKSKETKVKEEVTVNGQASTSDADPCPSLMWVDKYKPQTVKQIIGQGGDNSNVNKLTNWLTKWYSNREAKLPKPSPWAKNDDGGYYKAALLSGPPGVGKTTTVSLVCKELGFDMVEFNASDTRSKTLIRDQVGQLLTTTSLSGYARGVTGKGAVSKKHVLVMDEVDGMAGNEDRGGLQELISLIKSASVPIICMCNDRNSEKMRTLVNYCYDLRFTRPRADQIKARVMSICFKEKLKISPDVVMNIIAASGHDVRQVLHLLTMWAADSHGSHSTAPTKDVKMGPWEAIRKVFSAEEQKTMSVNDKSDLFFTDYSLMPLFVQENYLSVAPNCPKGSVMERLSAAADSISRGDLVDARIRGSQAWGLLPVQAMYASVIPGYYCSGRVCGQIQFPGWLGRNSRANKIRRLAQEVHAHTRLSTTGSKSSIYLDYAAHLRDAVVNPLITERNDGIDRALGVLEAYRLVREDLDSLTELSLWPGQRNPTLLIDSKVKAAMTRTYNKRAAPLPYLPQAVKKGRTQDNDADEYEIDDDEDDNDKDDGDPEKDVLIKKKKKAEVEKPSKSKSSTKKKK